MNGTTAIATAQSAWLGLLQKQVESLRFGTVQIVVHEGKDVQIEKTEKIRFEKPRPRVPDLARYSESIAT